MSVIDRARRALHQARGNRWTPPLVYAALVAGLAATVVVATPGLGVGWQVGGGVLVGLTVAASVALYRWLRPPLGRATSFAVVCLAWAGLWAGLAAASPDCMSSIRATRCSPSEVAQWSAIGLLFPLLVPAVTVLPWLTWRAVRRIWRPSRQEAPRGTGPRRPRTNAAAGRRRAS